MASSSAVKQDLRDGNLSVYRKCLCLIFCILVGIFTDLKKYSCLGIRKLFGAFEEPKVKTNLKAL